VDFRVRTRVNLGKGASIAVDSHGQAYVGAMVDHDGGHFAVVAYDHDGRERWSQLVRGSAPRDYEAAALAIGKGGRVHATGGTLDMFDWGLVDSWYLTNAYGADGALLWTDER
jgi:hypothetical protein